MFGADGRFRNKRQAMESVIPVIAEMTRRTLPSIGNQRAVAEPKGIVCNLVQTSTFLRQQTTLKAQLPQERPNAGETGSFPLPSVGRLPLFL